MSERRELYPKLKEFELKNFHLGPGVLDTVKVQLLALGLIQRSTSKKARSVSDRSAYFTLTPAGEAMLKEMQASIEAAHRELVKPLAPVAREQFLEQLLCLVQANNDKGRSLLRNL